MHPIIIYGLPTMSEIIQNSAIQKVIAVEKQVEKQTGVRPTYFEVLTAVALLIFGVQDCDIVIWETGMGGRLDATNVIPNQDCDVKPSLHSHINLRAARFSDCMDIEGPPQPYQAGYAASRSAPSCRVEPLRFV